MIRDALIEAGVAPHLVDLVEEVRDTLRAHFDAKPDGSPHPANIAEAMIIAGVILLRFNAESDEAFNNFLVFVFGKSLDGDSGLNLRPAPAPPGKPS